MLLQLGHFLLQAHHYTLPPLEGALRDSLGQILQDLKMMPQELEELLKTEMDVSFKDCILKLLLLETETVFSLYPTD